MSHFRLNLILVVIFAIGPVGCTTSSSSVPYFLGTFSSWKLWQVTKNGERVCYIVSEPGEKTGNDNAQRKPGLLVTRRSNFDEVSVQPGYTYLQGSKVRLNVGQNDFTLFTRGEGAWTENAVQDRALTQAMRQGKTVVVEGTASDNTTSIDTYSLSGFGESYDAMVDLCSKSDIDQE